ncbi:MAG TPA: DedA family protein [Candidatus Methylomirabilis sp.]|nr:DedA family protein [Candidatus Methylomirabilis sp.]
MFVVLGNMGVPIPEDPVLAVAGYMVWQGQLRLPIVLAVGILGAIAGDNLGYWIGREYGQAAIERYGHWILVTPERLESARRFVTRYGSLGVFGARFLPGLRFLAGPLAGTTGLPPASFFLANVLGAVLYVPLVVALGYVVGYGLGPYLIQLEQVVGQIEHILLLGVALCAVAAMGWRALQAARARRGS